MRKSFKGLENTGVLAHDLEDGGDDTIESQVMKEVLLRLNRSGHYATETGLPFVTISYAQGLDGSIAALPGRPLELSGFHSSALAHSLRAVHDGILVGIGTVLSDDPRLTVRMVRGPDPQRIVLDSRLRFPLNARMLHNNGSRPPWIMTSERVEQHRERALKKSGARVMRVVPDSNGQTDLTSVLLRLREAGITTLLVEGGAQIITSFLKARLVNQIVITIAPLLVGGLRVPDTMARPTGLDYPRLLNLSYEQAGEDLVLRGDPSWDVRV